MSEFGLPLWVAQLQVSQWSLDFNAMHLSPSPSCWWFYLVFQYVENVDFVIVSEIIIIPASHNQHMSSCGHIMLTILDDLIVEGNETIEIFLKSADPSRIFVRRENLLETRTLAIIDDDSECIK